MTCHEKLLMVVFLLLFITECDIEFVDPSKYTPPDDGLPMKNGIEEDPYEKIVRGNLQFLDKQKVFCNLGTHSSFFLYSPFFFSFFYSNFCHTISQGGRQEFDVGVAHEVSKNCPNQYWLADIQNNFTKNFSTTILSNKS